MGEYLVAVLDLEGGRQVRRIGIHLQRPFRQLHAERRVGRDDVWTRASLLHARGLVHAAQGRTERAESAFRQALEIIEPTMYAILTREIRRSLDSLRAADDVASR